MPNNAAIVVTDLAKSYRSGLLRRRFEALRGVSLQVERGEIFGLLGPNGAGKTTLIKVLLGIVRRSGGSASLLGKPAGDRAGRMKVGYLPENLRIAPHHTALTAMEYYGRLSGLPWSEIKSERLRLLESVGLADRSRESVRKFSKGMLQRLGLAQALLHDPELLILDEPTDGLDPVGRSHVRNVLTRLKEQGKTIFLNSHILQEVELICDRVAILDRGLVKVVGDVQDLSAHQSEGVELELVVAASEASVRQSLGSRDIAACQPHRDGTIRVVLQLPDQTAVDQCIDDLRAGGISIVGLSRRRVTLEDTFLKLFADTPEIVQSS
ncbi:MAG: ABC transporter ATP-binding protein [Planctomycetaceae bacterium]|nr:ABC transporter ATP-binding protein [Planctomycetales bacterium]MCB9936974.1 ABC transporter ATP-binding protein [Planctomycetaceae bacterium]